MAVPGLKVLAPWSSEDARGLMKAAIRDPDPVVFLENELLYGTEFPVSKEAQDKNWTVPIGKAKCERVGDDLSIITFSKVRWGGTLVVCKTSGPQCPPRMLSGRPRHFTARERRG